MSCPRLSTKKQCMCEHTKKTLDAFNFSKPCLRGWGSFTSSENSLFRNRYLLMLVCIRFLFFLAMLIEYSLCLLKQTKYLHAKLFGFYKDCKYVVFCFEPAFLLHLLFIGFCQVKTHEKIIGAKHHNIVKLCVCL